MIEEGLLSQKLFETEVSGKVTLPESDVDLFYNAHLEHYTEPLSVEVAHLVAAETSVIEAAQAANMKILGFAGGGHVGPALVDRLRATGAALFDDMTELPDLIDRY